MCREMKDSGIEWIGEINNEWSIVKIAKLAQFINGYAFNGEDLTIENEIPVIRIGDIQEGGVNLEGCLKYKKDKRLYNYSIQSKDVLIAMSGATTGKTAFINEVDSVAYINQRVGIIRNSKYSKYINYSLNTGEFKKYIDLLADGSAQPNISTKGIMNYYLALPNRGLDNIINYLDGKVSQINNVISKQKSLIEKYKAYKQSLITETVTKGLNKNVHMKDSGIDYLGYIPYNWSVKRLRFMGTLQNGISKSSEHFGFGYPFLSYGDVYKNEVIPKTVVGLVNSSEQDRENYSVKEGDVFFTRTSETIEEVGIASICMENIKDATFAGFIIRFRPMTDELYKGYSKYYFRCEIHRKLFVKEMNLVTRASLSQELLKKLTILIPSVEEQKEIAEFLDKKCNSIDCAISKKEELIEKLESYKKSLIYECVTGKRGVN